MKNAIRSAALLCVLAILLSLLPAVSAQELYVLPVFETSDVHGFLADTSSATDSTYQYRMAYIADKVDDVRNGDSSRTILLDGGDIYQGNVISNLQEGKPMTAAYDAMEYDAVALGNHEFDWGIELTADADGTMPDYTMDGISYQNDIPIVCSNLYDRGGKRVGFTKDYVIVDKTAVSASGKSMEVRIAVIGYAPNYASSIMTSRFSEFFIRENLNAAENLAKKLKAEGQADAAILLAHEDAQTLAGRMSGTTSFDLICGGHSHSARYGKTGAISYIQPWSQASSYAYAKLCFDSGKRVSVSGESVVSVTENKAHTYDTAANAAYLAPDVLALSRYYIDGVNDALTTSLGYITTSVTGDAIGSNKLSSTAGNWMTDLANRATGSKVSFTNSSGIRTSLYVNGGKRTVTKGDIYTIAPFGNLLYVYEMTYFQLLSVLEYGATRTSTYRMSGIDCYYSGGKVSALVEDGVCIYKDGRWLGDKKTQTLLVSANEFIATLQYGPFYPLNETCLVDSTMVDNESFIRVLEQERDSGNGLLYVDTQPHYISKAYDADISQDYTITTSFEGSGTVTPTTTVSYGTRFVVEFHPDDGWEISSIVIDGATYSPRESFVFGSVTKDHSVHVVFRQIPVHHCPSEDFSDLDSTMWYHDGVDDMLENGWMNGVGNGKFDPDGTLTRAMLVTVLYRMENEPQVFGAENPFEDVPAGQWYTDAIIWAASRGIVNGTSEKTFSPHEDITREQIATILYRYTNRPPTSGNLYRFTDVFEISDYALDAMYWAVGTGIIQGMGDRLAPQENATRAQIATILYRYRQ